MPSIGHFRMLLGLKPTAMTQSLSFLTTPTKMQKTTKKMNRIESPSTERKANVRTQKKSASLRRRFVASHVAAGAVWHRRSGTGRLRLDGCAGVGTAEVVANPAARADRLWRFTVPGVLGVRGQSVFGQSAG